MSNRKSWKRENVHSTWYFGEFGIVSDFERSFSAQLYWGTLLWSNRQIEISQNFFLLTQFNGGNKVGKISWNLVGNIMNWETHWSSKHHFRLGNTLINLETELLTTKHYFEVKIFRELETWKYVSKLIMVFPTKYVFPSS